MFRNSFRNNSGWSVIILELWCWTTAFVFLVTPPLAMQGSGYHDVCSGCRENGGWVTWGWVSHHNSNRHNRQNSWTVKTWHGRLFALHVLGNQQRESLRAGRQGFRKGGLPIWTHPSWFVLWCSFDPRVKGRQGGVQDTISRKGWECSEFWKGAKGIPTKRA